MKNRVLGWLFALVAAVVIIYLAASWYFGKAGQDRINENISQLNNELASQWSGAGTAPEIKIIDYKRGLLTSLITYQIEYQTDAESKSSILLADKLSHGPFPWTSLFNGDFGLLMAYSNIKPMHNGAMQNWFDLMPQDSYPWLMTNKYYFDDSIDSEIVLNAFSDDGIDFGGGKINANYDQNSNFLTAIGNFPNLIYFEDDTNTLFDLTEISFDISNLNNNLKDIQTHQQFNVSKLKATWSDNLDIVLENPGISIDSVQTNQLVNSKIEYDLGQVQVGDSALGNLRVAMDLENLNSKVLQEIVTVFDSQADESAIFDLKPETDKKLQLLFQDLFNSSPIISLENFQWQTPSANSNITSSVAFKPVSANEFESFSVVIEQALNQFELDFHIAKNMLLDVLKNQLDDRSLNLFNMMFDRYAAHIERLGLVTIKDNVLSGDLRYANGLYTVNGSVMSPAELGQRLGSIISP